MSVFKKMYNPMFWENVTKVAIPFFITVTIFSLLLSNFKAVFSGNFTAVYETNFSDGKWIRFWSLKVVSSLIYGIWIANKRMA